VTVNFSLARPGFGPQRTSHIGQSKRFLPPASMNCVKLSASSGFQILGAADGFLLPAQIGKIEFRECRHDSVRFPLSHGSALTLVALAAEFYETPHKVAEIIEVNPRRVPAVDVSVGLHVPN
jgi:hypothetical protein